MKDTRVRQVWCLFAGMLVTAAFQLAHAVHEFPPCDQLYTLLSDNILAQACAVLALAYLTYRAFSCGLSVAHKLVLGALAALFGILNVCGCNLAYLDSLMIVHGSFWQAIFCLCVVGYALGFYVVAACLWDMADRVTGLSPARRDKIPNWAFLTLCFVAIFSTWMLWIVVYYPATVDFDTEWQLTVYLGIVERSNHHPWFSTLILGSLFSLGRMLANDNVGMFIYILLRALVMTAIYVRGIAMLRRAGCSKMVLACVVLFYAITPVWGAYAKQPFKDTLATALFSWYAFSMFNLYLDLRVSGRVRMASCLEYTMAGTLAALYRNNLYYVALIMTVLMVGWLLVKRSGWKQALLVALVMPLCLAWNALLWPVFHVVGTETEESLSLPFQQTARTVKYHGNEIPAEERAVMNGLIAYDEIGDRYDMVIYDPVKEALRHEMTSEDVSAYLQVWRAQLSRYPLTYLEAAFAHTYGYYTFTRDGYPTGGRGNCGMVILENINRDADHGYDVYFDFSYIDAYETARTVLSGFARLWHRLPLLSLTDSIPFYTWAAILFLVYACCAREKKIFVMPVLAMGVVWLSCLASPVNGSFRYFAPFAAAFPVLLGCWTAAHTEYPSKSARQASRHYRSEQEGTTLVEPILNGDER